MKGNRMLKINTPVNIFNSETGEILAEFNDLITIQTDEDIRKRKEYFEKKQNKEGRIKSLYEQNGNFIWNIHTTAKIFLPDIKDSSLTRLMFISTYLGYEGYLINDKKKALTKSNIFGLLKISDSEFRRFWKEMIDSKLLQVNEEKIYLNKEVFNRGNINSDYLKTLSEDQKCLTRIYIEGVRSLYETATLFSHKTLSYIFRILPYVSRDYNICCFNPLEADKCNLDRMSLGEFADIVGYDRTHISRLAKILFDPQFKTKDGMKSAVRYVVDKSLNKETYSMFINPKVYYMGNKRNEIEILGQF